jgi:DNA polymerase III alpha subunit
MPVTFPQLRVRTEFSFKNVYAPLPEVVAALREAECPAAGIVDGGTWGHVRWAKAMGKAGMKPLLGREVDVPEGDGPQAPKAWVLARDARSFYRVSSALESAAPASGATAGALLRDGAVGLLRFRGASSLGPESVDYADLNPTSPRTRAANIAFAKRTGIPLVLTSDICYPRPSDAEAFEANGGRQRPTPQHLLSESELRDAIPELSKAEFARAVRNTWDAAATATAELPKAPMIRAEADLWALVREGQAYRLAAGHIEEWTEEREARVQREMSVIAAKQYESYFAVVAEMVTWAKRHMLVGPGRGSSAGSLVCYLLRITEVDPFEHDLLFERFIDLTRSDLPDIDIDFEDSKRHLVFTHLAERYGASNVCRIGSINSLRSRSVLARVTERLGIPERDKYDVMNVLLDYSSGDSRYGHALEDTMSQTEPGRKFIANYPEAEVMYRLEGHASHTGVHAAGVIVCNDPVGEFCTIGAEGIAQLDKPDAEALGLLKIDALGLRTLGVIGDTGVITGEELYGLKLNDPAAFAVLNQRRYAGVFQFEGQAQRLVAREVPITSFRQLDHITALSRPGPLGGGASQHYIARINGREDVTLRHPSMSQYLSKTMGVVLYQEQVMRICAEIGQFSWEVVSEIRKAMSASKGREYFDRRGQEFLAGAATVGLKASEAQTLWDEICTFGAWGMNASHTVSYSIISYWCAWLKAHYPLEFGAACLRNAADDEQALDILRDLVGEGIRYIPFDPDRSEEDWSVQDGAIVGGFRNLVGFGPAKSAKAIADRAAGKLNREKLDKAVVKFAELYPLRAAWGHVMDHPEEHGARDGSRTRLLNDLPEEGNCLFLCSVVTHMVRDENEALRISKRRGKVLTGQTLFLDVKVTDDTGTPVTLRIDRFKFNELARDPAGKLAPGDVLMVRGDRIPGFSMVKVRRWKCLNREGVIE